MMEYIGILSEIFGNRRCLQNISTYSRIFVMLLQLVVRWVYDNRLVGLLAVNLERRGGG